MKNADVFASILSLLQPIDDYITAQDADVADLTSQLTSAQEGIATLKRMQSNQYDYIKKLERQQAAQRVIGVALCFDWENIQYKFAGDYQTDGKFDCSSFTRACYRIGTQEKIILPRTSAQQATVGVSVDPADIQVGDTLHYDFDGDGKITHVAMAMDANTLIHTNNPTNDINIMNIADYNRSKLVAVRRHIL